MKRQRPHNGRLAGTACAAALALTPALATSALAQPAHTPTSAATLSRFEHNVARDRNVIYFSRRNLQSCSLKISLVTSGHNETHTCDALYGIVDQNGRHVFVVFDGPSSFFYYAPPGGTKQDEGVYWPLNHAGMDSPLAANRHADWPTSGLCLVGPQMERCQATDGKVATQMNAIMAGTDTRLPTRGYNPGN